MKKSVIYFILFLVVAIAGTIFTVNSCSEAKAEKRYKIEQVTRGDVVNMVSCSGTLEAVGTVEVGTQVSGVLDHIYVDFNDRVKKGQVLAVLDTIMLKAQVLEAIANYDKAEAQLDEAKADRERNLPLFKKGFISEAEYLPYKINLRTQEASLKSAEATVIRAKRNLKYAVIRSPIDGTIIQRSVEEGQTVAASLQAPVLFIIAEDLSKMEIHAQVDESDIGQIKQGQKAVFEVQAYQDKSFEGVVWQIRLQPEVVQNVVNYTVVIKAENKEGLLLPGMTATIDFYVQELRDVLLVPNTALRFQPPEEAITAFRERMQKRFATNRDSSNHSGQGGFRAFPGGSASSEDYGRVWVLNGDGQLDMAGFQRGSTDGKMTQIISSRSLKEGSQVVVGWTSEEDEMKNSSSQNGGRRFGPPRIF
jgi:HlyD family secretion protein